MSQKYPAPILALVGATALTLACTACPAAQPIAQAPALHGHLAGFDRDADQLPRAIRRLELGGGRVTEIRFDGRRGRPGFDAVVERAGRVAFLRLERGAKSYVAIARKDEPAWMLDRRSRRVLAAAQRAQVDLADAVRTAESDTSGEPAVAAGIATLASNPLRETPVFNVLLLRGDDRLERVAVDARTGLSIANLSTLEPWPSP